MLSVWVSVPLPQEPDADVIARACDISRLGYRFCRAARVRDFDALSVPVRFEPDPNPTDPSREAVDPGATCHYNMDITTVTAQRVADVLAVFGPEIENPTWPTWRGQRGTTT
jgi:hypothetical protein